MKIPEIDSMRELAEFWDTHDVTELADELVEVAEPVFARRPTKGVTISGFGKSCTTEPPSNMHPRHRIAVFEAMR